MSTPKIERVDDIPIIFQWLTKMHVAEMIDRIWPSHGNWQGLSYGQLAVLFITYVVHSLNHRLCGMESWVARHQHTLEHLTGWSVDPKQATDDRLGILLGELGRSPERLEQYQIQHGHYLIQAYELPTRVVRYDTTSVNVYHTPLDSKNGGLLTFGYSKDRRPDLVQFKQGLGTLDPAGVPLMTETLKGNEADDGRYVQAWRRLKNTVGHSNFFLIGDSKGAALETRGQLAAEGGYYLFPLPMTGQVPEILAAWVREGKASHSDLWLGDEEERRRIGEGFEVEQTRTVELAGVLCEWKERCLVIKSDSHAERQQLCLSKRLEKAEEALEKLCPRATESREEFQARAEKVLEKHEVSDLIQIQIDERIEYHKRYLKAGRPGPKTPHHYEEISFYRCSGRRDEEAIKRRRELMGWRIYVTNTTAEQMSLEQSVDYYRDEWTVERGFHRFKRGSLPVLPLFIRLEERIKGLLFLLFIALQVLTLMEFVVRRELAKEQGQLAGLVPGNPKMKTARPTAERLLAQFKELHVIVERQGPCLTGYLVETLTPLQEKVLSLLKLPKEIYNLSFSVPVTELKYGT
jgi:transposase